MWKKIENSVMDPSTITRRERKVKSLYGGHNLKRTLHEVEMILPVFLQFYGQILLYKDTLGHFLIFILLIFRILFHSLFI